MFEGIPVIDPQVPLLELLTYELVGEHDVFGFVEDDNAFGCLVEEPRQLFFLLDGLVLGEEQNGAFFSIEIKEHFDQEKAEEFQGDDNF